jgi:hypothetical protein
MKVLWGWNKKEEVPDFIRKVAGDIEYNEGMPALPSHDTAIDLTGDESDLEDDANSKPCI